MNELINRVLHGQPVEFEELDAYFRNLVDVLDGVREEPLEGNSFEDKLKSLQAEHTETLAAAPDEDDEADEVKEERISLAAHIRAIDLWFKMRP